MLFFFFFVFKPKSLNTSFSTHFQTLAGKSLQILSNLTTRCCINPISQSFITTWFLSHGQDGFWCTWLWLGCRPTQRDHLWLEPVVMDEDVSEETLTSGLTLLVKVGKVLLETAKQDAEGRTELEEGCCCNYGLQWKLECFNVCLCLER